MNTKQWFTFDGLDMFNFMFIKMSSLVHRVILIDVVIPKYYLKHTDFFV